MRILLLFILAACAPLTEAERERNEIRLAEKRELWGYYQHACTERADRIWICHADERMSKQHPWLFCGCANSRDL